jgi:hypothetical protein
LMKLLIGMVTGFVKMDYRDLKLMRFTQVVTLAGSFLYGH